MSAFGWKVLVLGSFPPATYDRKLVPEAERSRAFRAYLTELHALEVHWIERFRAKYPAEVLGQLVDQLTTDRLERLALRTILAHEADGGDWRQARPVGIYAGNVDAAAKADSSAYGVGQVVASTWLGVGDGSPHWTLLHPWYGLRAALAVWRDAKHGGRSDANAWNAYAGTPQSGAVRLSTFTKLGGIA